MRIRNTLLILSLLISLTAHAQFVDVDWSNNKGDSILPVCTQTVDLPSDYAGFSYSAHVEYPEFRRMTSEEIARYSLAGKYAFLPEQPNVECHVGIQAKRAQLDMAFVPVVMRDGVYYRIDSYKLVVDRKPLPNLVASVSRSAGERYAAASVLAQGKWVRIAVSENGIHKITHAELKKMGFKDPSKVRLYGYGGHVLPEKNIESLIDDLVEVPLWREGSFVLFYANGTISWSYQSGRYVHLQNHYSEYGCYFLTEGDEAPMEFPSATLQATTEDTYTTFRDYALHENETKSLCSYGRVLVDDYDYSHGRKVNYKIPVAGVVENSPATIDLSFATNGIEMSRVAISVGGENLGSLTVSRAVSTELGKISSGKFNVNALGGDNPVISLTHSVSNNSVNGFLDFIRLNYMRRLAIYGSQTQFRGDMLSGNALFKIEGANADTRVWSVGGTTGIKELEGLLEGSVYSVVAPADRDENMVVFNVKGSFPSVKVMGDVANQNLHALGQTDMVMIVPSNGSFLQAAEKLAEAHRTMDGITVAVVTAQQVYNEFSSGTPDVTAYRRFMKMLYDRAASVEDAPKYLLLFGDGWYDNRLITFHGRKQEDYLLCYESQNSIDAVHSYVLEDYMGLLDDGEGGNHLRDKVDLGIGRIPAQTRADADAVVEKLIAYMQNRNAGAWQNKVLLLADDGDEKMPNQHMKDADVIADVMERNYPSYAVDRVYWDDYPAVASSTGKRYPEVTQTIYDKLNEGALVVNYSGHGSANLLSHEMVWKASDMAALKSPRMPLWVTASCDIGPFDMGDNSVAEAAILNHDGAAIGLFTTTRTVLQSYNSVINKAFMEELLQSVNNGEAIAVGNAVRKAKNRVISVGSDPSENKLQFVLLGDPALRLKTPAYRIVVEQFNKVGADVTTQVSAGGFVEIEGYVADAGGKVADDFEGLLYLTLFDGEEVVNTRDNTGLGSYQYNAFNKKLFSGNDSIKGGRFVTTIPVPMDISYKDQPGMLNLFAVDTAFVNSAQGHFGNFTVGGTSQDINDDGTGPEIKLYLNTASFVDGDEVNTTPCLFAELYDENGINTVGTGIGHDIVAIVDNRPEHTYNLNSMFTSNAGDYKRGTIVCPLKALEAGEHTLLLRAWDLYNNSSTAEVRFVVEPSLAPEFVQLRVNPSPVRYGQTTRFELTHNRPQSELQVRIEIFDFQGKMLWSSSEKGLCDSMVYNFEWDGRLAGGQPLATGVYLARAWVVCDGKESSTRTIKFVVVNNK